MSRKNGSEASFHEKYKDRMENIGKDGISGIMRYIVNPINNNYENNRIDNWKNLYNNEGYQINKRVDDVYPQVARVPLSSKKINKKDSPRNNAIHNNVLFSKNSTHPSILSSGAQAVISNLGKHISPINKSNPTKAQSVLRVGREILYNSNNNNIPNSNLNNDFHQNFSQNYNYNRNQNLVSNLNTNPLNKGYIPLHYSADLESVFYSHNPLQLAPIKSNNNSNKANQIHNSNVNISNNNNSYRNLKNFPNNYNAYSPNLNPKSNPLLVANNYSLMQNNNNGNNYYPYGVNLPFSNNINMNNINNNYKIYNNSINNKSDAELKRSLSPKYRPNLESIIETNNLDMCNLQKILNLNSPKKGVSGGQIENGIYRPYNLEDYKKLVNVKVELGSLGPNIGTKEWEERQEKMKKMEEYAYRIKETNKPPSKGKKEMPIEMIEKEKFIKKETSNRNKAYKYDTIIREKNSKIMQTNNTHNSSNLHNSKNTDLNADEPKKGQNAGILNYFNNDNSLGNIVNIDNENNQLYENSYNADNLNKINNNNNNNDDYISHNNYDMIHTKENEVDKMVDYFDKTQNYPNRENQGETSFANDVSNNYKYNKKSSNNFIPMNDIIPNFSASKNNLNQSENNFIVEENNINRNENAVSKDFENNISFVNNQPNSSFNNLELNASNYKANAIENTSVNLIDQ